MTGRLVSLLATRTQQTADAAFHLFEIKVADDEPASVAVFMRKGDNPTALSWRLSRSLSDYVSSPRSSSNASPTPASATTTQDSCEELTGVLLPTRSSRRGSG